MTKLAVVAYPIFSETDRQWIESIRAKHDPQARLIGAHFTLVFPADAEPEATAHVRSVVSDAKPISFVVNEAKAVRDLLGGGSHVFLIPGDGSPQLIALHDRLYDGIFRNHLCRDVPYVPHITVGADPAFERCLALAQELNVARRVVRGRIESADVVRVGADVVQSVASFTLG